MRDILHMEQKPEKSCLLFFEMLFSVSGYFHTVSTCRRRSTNILCYPIQEDQSGHAHVCNLFSTSQKYLSPSK